MYASPAVRVTVQTAPDAYPDEVELAEELTPLVQAYVQRVGVGDPRRLAELANPHYKGEEAEARRWIEEYRQSAGGSVTAKVASNVPYLAGVELSFSDGRRQQLSVYRADGVWGLAMGEPVREPYEP
ncbi:hypothetical protein [Streptomyces sp. NPDC046887]|uniref:hypothetical protein n=1 Tax=Streptomyces sp. NPDC046887 TaxID=3155472 RepID=UPI0033D9A73D